MSQDNQNQDPQNDRQNPSPDDITRESRTGSSDSPQDQVGSDRQGSSPELDDVDEMDEDRDDDARGDGSPNRRNNIG